MTVTLESWGSFHVGGRTATVEGRPVRDVLFTPGGVPARMDPNGDYLVGALYAQYMVPAERRGACPLLLWHGGGLTGACWETTPDGREGWQHFFLRRGWPVTVSDAVERGRAGSGMLAEAGGGEPITMAHHEPWERFRIGERPFAAGRPLPGCRFPIGSYDNLVRQMVPTFTASFGLALDAYGALLERVGPSAVVTHSQSAYFGWHAAGRWPERFRALVLVEPATTGDPAQAAALARVPQLLVYGDFIAGDPRWPTMKANGLAFAAQVRAAGGSVDILDLPAMGIAGNSHMLMHDSNSDQVAGLIQDWLAAKGLWA